MRFLPKRRNKQKTSFQQREQTRGWLAKMLVGTLILTIVLTFIFVGTEVVLEVSGKDVDNQDLRELLTLILQLETTLIGTVLGFYFGSKNSNNS